MPVAAKLFMSSTNILIGVDRSTIINRDNASITSWKMRKVTRNLCLFPPLKNFLNDYEIEFLSANKINILTGNVKLVYTFL